MLKSYHKLWHENPWEIEHEKVINNELIPIWNTFMMRKMDLDGFLYEVKKLKSETVDSEE
jgi:hypothetical protein